MARVGRPPIRPGLLDGRADAPPYRAGRRPVQALVCISSPPALRYLRRRPSGDCLGRPVGTERRDFPLTRPNQVIELREKVGFDFVIPCWVPADLTPTPWVRDYRQGYIAMSYDPPGSTGMNRLQVLQEMARRGRTPGHLAPGYRLRRSSSRCPGVRGRPGGTSADIEWILGNAHFQVVGSYSGETLTQIASGMDSRLCGAERGVQP